MFSPPGSDYWSSFESDLFRRLTDIELTSRSSNKFEPLVAWLANQWGLETGSVACKYVQHPKNRWNRLREALRRNPAAILLLFEGEDDGVIEERVSQGAVLSPSLALVVVLVRPLNREWRFCRILYRHFASLPHVLRSCAGLRTTQFSVPQRTTPRGAPRPTPDPSVDLEEALRGLALIAHEPKSKQRSDIADSIAAFTGLQPDSIGFKTIPSTKNLGNRLGEALGLSSQHPRGRLSRVARRPSGRGNRSLAGSCESAADHGPPGRADWGSLTRTARDPRPSAGQRSTHWFRRGPHSCG